MHEKKNTILVVDDEPHFQKMLGILLDTSDFKLVQSMSGREAIRLCVSVKPDIILLDLGLADMNGKDVITAIREWSQVPIIVVSARSGNEDVVVALNTGADDYVTKPFNIDILLARIRACLRKSAIHTCGEPQLCNGDLRIDLVSHQVFIKDKLVAFTPKEYDLLRYFIVNRGKMLTHKEILKEVWGEAHGEDKQYLRVFVGQIRDKMEKNQIASPRILTEPGIGYRMEIIDAVTKQKAEAA